MIDANSQFFAILTNLGMAKQANADALGIPWKITEMGVGDANNTDPIPNASQTTLINEWRRRPLNQLKIDPINPAVLIAEQIIPADEGGKWIREIGLYDADGDLVAVANCAPSFKPILSQGSGRTQIVRMNFIVTSTGNITLKIDPAIVLASRAYVDAAILEVLPKNKTPGEWTRVKTNDRGIVVSGDNPSTLAGMGITDSYTKAQIEAMIAQASALPVGNITAFPLNKIAPGFLELDGSVKSIAVYPDLAAYLGTAFNKGDEGAGNFRLPESRGEFLRGWDHGRGVDVGRVLGSWQADENKAHAHATDYELVNDTFAPGATSRFFVQDFNALNNVQTKASGGVESRPRNLAVMWCIKAWNAPINQGNIDIAALEQLVISNAPGRLLGIRRIRTTQVYNATLGTNKIRVRGEGAGGAGGGAYSTAAGQLSAGTGGGAGAYFDTWITGGFDGALVTIGKGGVGALLSRGGNGGATSFGSFATAPGGYGGGLTTNTAPPIYLGRSPNSEFATGGTLSNAWGQGGGGVIGPSLSFAVSGEGGASRWGAGGNSIGASSSGVPAGMPGAGGGGALALQSYPAHLKGGDGGDGWVEIEEWT
ncbi:phage tail protein [Pseudomonas sp. A-RE-19]|uniref:phage tail protein n=1 Tax=Pseudomonas sp. A-RE-19 TaxID=2832401 RepID=UPI001CBBF1FF|nr:phage tail protein [Pseudomonas sp. A-RE-19]